MYNSILSVIFDGSFEGFLCIIYAHYYEKINPEYIEIENCYQQRLNTDYIFVKTELEKSDKVINGIVKKISKESANLLYLAYLSDDDERFINMYKYILLGFKKGKEINKYLNYDFVLKTLNYKKNVTMEMYRQNEFLRFIETEKEIYYAEISPDNNILILVADFFIGRFKEMSFVIHDVKRDLVAIYDSNECIIREAPKDVNIIYSKAERQYQKLWINFYRAIAIKERTNKKLQNAFLPVRYRKHMIEFRYILEEYKNEGESLPDKI